MKFLSPEEIKEIYNASLAFSGYYNLTKQIQELWLKFVLSGFNDLPPGFLARLSEKITHGFSGEEITDIRNDWENNLIHFIARDEGFKQIEGEFIISGKKIDQEKVFLSLEKIFDKLGTFSRQYLKFTEKDLYSSFNLNSENQNDNLAIYENIENLVKESYEKALNFSELLDEEDLFEIKNPELFLADQRARKLYRIMNRLISQINFYLIGEISIKPESDFILAKYGEEQVLPVGGYDSLINKGDISSLLSSELSYIDQTEKIDYFDYKYMQKELLYYKREEGSVFRLRRSVLIDIETDYSVEHEKNLAILFAFCLSIVEKLVSVFTKDIIKINIVFSGTLSTGMNYALNFLQYFINRQKYDENVFILGKNEKLKAFEDKSYQPWTIGNNQLKDEKCIKLNFPSFDLLNTLDDQSKGRVLADTINKIIEQVAEIASS